MKAKYIWVLEITNKFTSTGTATLYFSSMRKILRYLKSQDARLRYIDSAGAGRYESEDVAYLAYKDLLN